MKLVNIVDEDFINYKLANMYLIFPKCSFKCNKDCDKAVCQNEQIAQLPTVEFTPDEICKRYLENPLTHSIVCGGLEPFDTPYDLLALVDCLRVRYKCDDPVVIYTGYTNAECSGVYTVEYPGSVQSSILASTFNQLKQYKNIIVKFGRYIPDKQPVYDKILGVELAGKNQYAEVISEEK